MGRRTSVRRGSYIQDLPIPWKSTPPTYTHSSAHDCTIRHSCTRSILTAASFTIKHGIGDQVPVSQQGGLYYCYVRVWARRVGLFAAISGFGR